MPYTKQNLPNWVKTKLPSHAQDIWMGAFNSALKQYKEEKRAFKVAISAVKKAGYKKNKKGTYSKMAGETTAGSLDPNNKTISRTFAGKKRRKKKMKKMSKFVKLSAAYKKDLPDSAFAVVIKQGDKNIRKLPFKDKAGKVDIPHLRNAIIMVAQGKTKLSPSTRAQAMGKLKSVAESYLKTNKETRSGEIMSKFISKFDANVVDKLDKIVDTLKGLAENKKPDEEVAIAVKNVSLLIQDLEEVKETLKSSQEAEEEEKDEETEEKEEKESEDKDHEETKETEDQETKEKEEKSKKSSKKEKDSEEDEETEDEDDKFDDKETKEKKKETKEKEETKDEEGKDDDEEKESKFKEALKLCEDYKKQLDKTKLQMSKFEKRVDELEKEKKEMKTKLSKFESESYEKILNSTVEKISKFRGLNEDQTLALRKRYLESKMSGTALEEVGRVTDDKMFSKLAEPKETTKPSEMLDPVEDEGPDFSKMSEKEKKDYQLNQIADGQARARGFVNK